MPISDTGEKKHFPQKSKFDLFYFVLRRYVLCWQKEISMGQQIRLILKKS